MTNRCASQDRIRKNADGTVDGTHGKHQPVVVSATTLDGYPDGEEPFTLAMSIRPGGTHQLDFRTAYICRHCAAVYFDKDPS